MCSDLKVEKDDAVNPGFNICDCIKFFLGGMVCETESRVQVSN